MRLNFLPLLVVLLGSMAAGAAFQGQEHHYDNPHNIVAVLAAIAPPPFQRLQAWFHSTKGLILLSIPRSLRPADSPTALFPAAFDKLASASLPAPFLLGSASSAPAFDDNGDLYFQRSLDDGNSTVLLLEDWVLPFNSKRISPVSDDEGVPSSVQERRASGVGIPQQIASRAPFKITVDPGHGGSDPGAVAQGYREKDFTLDVSLRLRDLLLADRGLWSVQMTRSTDIDVSLTARTNMANAWPADRFVSIHINSFSSSSAQGTETYSYAEGSTAAKLRDRIQQEAVKAWGLVDRGSKTENFHVLRETTMPATLSELGFITSPVDIVKLSDPNARKQMAAAHLYALQYHMGVSFNLPVLAEDITKED